MAFDSETDAEQFVDAIRAKVQAPGFLLIIAGALNLLIGVLSFFTGTPLLNGPEEQLKAEHKKTQDELTRWPEFAKTYKQQVAEAGGPVKYYREMGRVLCHVVAPIVGFSGLLSMLGGIRMRSLRSWPMACLGALAMSIPFISVLSCCGLGLIVGLWCLILLMSSDVREGFRLNAQLDREAYESMQNDDWGDRE